MSLFGRREPQQVPAGRENAIAMNPSEPSPPHEVRDEGAAGSIKGERGIPSVNRVRSVQARVSGALAFTLMGALGVGLLAWYYSGAATRQARLQAAAQDASRSRASGETQLPPLGRIEPPAPPRAPAEPEATEPTLGSAFFGEPPPLPEALALSEAAAPAVVPAAYGYGADAMTPAERSLSRRLAGPPFASVSSHDSVSVSAIGDRGYSRAPGASIPSALPEGAWPSSSASAGSPDEGAVGSATPLEALLRPSTTPAVQARVLPTRRLLLPKGAFLDCTLETAINSSLPGMTTCVTATDTFGADGRVVLLERGTKLVGETRGQVSQGSARLFVLWTEARTPTGVVVPLASPGTDELGRAGLTGEVNRHFWQRFGAAILISVIDGAVQAAVASSRSDDGGAIVVSPSGSSEIMTEVLKSTLATPPTIVKPHGDRLQVLVARDLDFRAVYELRTADARPR